MSTFQQIRVETVDNGCRTRRGGVCAGVEARMQIAVFGASGRTGNLLTERALAGGHTVASLLRRPAEFPFRDRVRVVAGDAFDPGGDCGDAGRGRGGAIGPGRTVVG